MKLNQFVFAPLLLIGVLSCSDDIPLDEGRVIINTDQTDNNSGGEKGDSSVVQVSSEVVAQYLAGQWELIRQGNIEGPWNIFIEFRADKEVVCEYNVGASDYKKTTCSVEYENDWTMEENKLTGHLLIPFCGENRFNCCIEGNKMILAPADGVVNMMDPTKYLIKVPSTKPGN